MSTSAERPFGDLYTTADYNFLAAMNDKVGWKRTPQEDAETKKILKLSQRMEQYLSPEDKSGENEEVLGEVKRLGVEIAFIRKHESENIFILDIDPIRFSLVQGERRTRLIFQPRPDNRLDPHFLYGLFLVDLPKAFYGEGRDAPSPEVIRESSTFTLIDIKRNVSELRMEVPQEREEFEKILENPNDVLGVKMSCEGLGASHTLIYPNPQTAKDKFIQFSFPSRQAITPETIDVLLGIQRDGFRLAPDNKTFSSAFSGAVNCVREAYRIK